MRAVTEVVPPGEALADVGGVNVHAGAAIDGRDRKRLERLCRYIARPPLAQERLEEHGDGRLRYRFKRPWRNGTYAVVLELREHFGDELLVRSGARMRSTPLAERLRPLVREAMAAASQVLGEPAPFVAAETEAELRVATSDHMETVVLEPLVAALMRLAPRVRVGVEPFSPAAVARTHSGEVDLVLAPRTHMGEGLRVTRVLEEPYAVVVRRRHPALDDDATTISLEAFTTLEHVVVAPGGGGSRPPDTATDRALLEHGRSRRVTRLVTSFSQALLLVSTSDHLAIVPWSFAARFAGRLRLAVLRAPVELAPSRIDAGWSERVHHDPLHVWFRQQVIEVARRERRDPAS